MPLPKSRTVPDLLDEIADRFPDREALVGGGRQFAYAELRDEVRTFAKGLHALGASAHVTRSQCRWKSTGMDYC